MDRYHFGVVKGQRPKIQVILVRAIFVAIVETIPISILSSEADHFPQSRLSLRIDIIYLCALQTTKLILAYNSCLFRYESLTGMGLKIDDVVCPM